MVLRITCEGATTVELDEVQDLQGNFKSLSEDDYVKLRNSMVEFGFSFPLFIWIDPLTNIKWAIDGHQRNFRALPKMRQEGWTIPPLPAVIVHAADRIEAKKKLLVLNSRYGKVTAEGITDFLNEPDYLIPSEEILDFLSYPEDDFEDKPKKEKKLKETICPKCGEVFTN